MPNQVETLEAEWQRPGAKPPPVDLMRSLIAEAEARIFPRFYLSLALYRNGTQE